MKKEGYFREAKVGYTTEHQEKSDLRAGVPAKTRNFSPFKEPKLLHLVKELHFAEVPGKQT